MANRISTVFDFRETGGLKKIKAEIAAADTATGKLKAGFAGAMTSLKANAVQAAAAAGAALVAFAVKAGDEFANAAVEVGRFSDATGLSTEQASKWVALADDLGVEAGAVEKAFLRLNKEIGEGGGVVAEYGIELKRTKDGAVDVNATMLDAIRVMNGIKDPTERARVAQELFGRSYADVAEIIFEDANKVAAALESTSEAQIFDQDEINKAREYRAAMDRFNDVMVDLKYTIGEGVVPVLTDAADAAVDFKEAVGSIPGAPKAVQAWWDNASPVAWIRRVGDGWEYAGQKIGLVGGSSEQAEKALAGATREAWLNRAAGLELEAQARATAEEFDNYVDSLKDSTREQTYAADASEEMGRIQEATNRVVARAREAQRRFMESIRHTRDEVGKLKRDIDDEQAWLNLQESIEATTAKMNDGEASTRDQRLAVLDLKEEVLEYAESINLPDKVTTQLLALIDQGKLAEVEALLAKWGNGVTLPIRPRVISTGGGSGIRIDENGNVRSVRGNASGTTYSPGGPTLVGERGREIVDLPRGARVRSAVETVSALSGGSAMPSFTTIIEGNVYGVDHLNRLMDERDRRLLSQLRQGVRR